MPSRVIKGEINASDSLSRVSIEADLTFRALLVACDDYGRFDGRLAVLKAALFPMRDEMTPKRINKAIDELVAVGTVRRYSADGRDYLALPNWEKHRAKGRRANTSKYPEPSSEILGDPRKSEELHDRVDARGSLDEGRGTLDVSKPPARSARGGKTAAPEKLSDEEHAALEVWCLDYWPTLIPRLKDLTAACLTFHRAKGNRHADWYATVQTWVRNEAEGRFGRAANAPPIRAPSKNPSTDELWTLSRRGLLQMATLDYWREWVAAGKPERARWWIKEAIA